MKTAFIANKNDPFGSEIAKTLTEQGWQVYGGSPDSVQDQLSLLVLNTHEKPKSMQHSLSGEINFDEIEQIYEKNTLEILRLVNLLLPKTTRGCKLCFVTEQSASIGLTQETTSYGYQMAQAALHMAAHNMFNLLYPKEYFFRLYCKTSDISMEQDVFYAVRYFLQDRSDEDRFVMRDYALREYPF